MKVLLFIPARGGSKTIPLKNLHPLGGFPLIHWVLSTCRLFNDKYDVVVSTDHPEIKHYSLSQNVRVVDRPDHLSDGAIGLAVVDYLHTHHISYDIIVLVQPTSPFITVGDIESTIQGLTNHKYISSQTICEVPHNNHAWNLRTFKRHDPTVGWYEPDMRTLTNRKQGKPLLFKFGNCVAVRGDPTVLPRYGFFALPSKGIEIPWVRAVDTDSLDDFDLAEMVIKSGRV